MAKRGRPRYPDILTPREWEVLALLREELSNEEIAERLDIAERTARYHVSEILGKLGVGSRADAAGWDPEQRPWWMTAVAPLAFVWRKASFGWLSPAAAAAVAVVVIGGVGLLVWGLVRTQGNEGVGPPISSVLVDPPDELVWSGMVSVDSGTCGDPATAESYGVPMMLRIPEDRGPRGGPVLLGLEAEPYDYVPTQVRSSTYEQAPDGWAVNSRLVAAFGAHPNRFSTQELFLRRLDQPSLLFRYDAGFCNQEDGTEKEPPTLWGPSGLRGLPDDPPEITTREDADGPFLNELTKLVAERYGSDIQLVRAEQMPSGDWVVELAGNGMGPARRGHVYGFEVRIDASTGRVSGETCCTDFVTSQ